MMNLQIHMSEETLCKEQVSSLYFLLWCQHFHQCYLLNVMNVNADFLADINLISTAQV